MKTYYIHTDDHVTTIITAIDDIAAGIIYRNNFKGIDTILRDEFGNIIGS